MELRNFSRSSVRWFTSVVAVVVLVVALAPISRGQELDCTVSIDYSALSGSDFSHLGDLSTQIREYLNRHPWTDDQFMPHERIKCSFDITFTNVQGLDRFRAQLNVGSQRPIYGTTQYTSVFQHADRNWQFTYVENQSLRHDLSTFSQIESVLDFYAFIILGYDYDTFSGLGGTPFFEQARNVAELAQSNGAVGWDPVQSDRTRGALVEQLLDQRLQPVRRAYFQYHFGGLDHFTTETQKARKSVLEAVSAMHEVYESQSSQYIIDMFFSTKYRELAAIFQGSDLGSQAYSLLVEVDPSHSSTYNTLVQ